MPRVSETFSGRSLAADDMDGQPMAITITHVEEKRFEDGVKLIVEFEELDKIFICNKTNANTIASFLGDDTDDWVGRRIVLYPTRVDFQGRRVLAIRVRTSAAPPPPRRVARPARPVTQQEADAGDDTPF